MGLLVILFLAGDGAELQVGVEVVRIEFELGLLLNFAVLWIVARASAAGCKPAKTGSGERRLLQPHPMLCENGVREIGIERFGFGEFVARTGKIGDVHFGTAEH